MSMNLADLETSIINRLSLDTTLTDAVQGIYNTVAHPDAELGRGKKPYVVLSDLSWTTSDTFADNVAEIAFRIYHIDAIENGRSALSTIMDRTYGNALGQDNSPTYGLHRWQMTVTGDNVPGKVRWQGGGTDHTPEALRYYVDYAVILTEGQAS